MTFKKYLKTTSHKELINLLLSLYDGNKTFKTIIESAIDPEKEKETFDKYYKKLEKVFSDPFNFSLAAAINIVEEYEGIGARVPEMNLYFAQFLADFTNEFGDIDDEFYDVLVKAGLKAIHGDEEFLSSFSDEIELLINDCGCFGWGVYDTLQSEWVKTEHNYK